jgi:uncharacterized protein YdaU (DUF1376 family)
MNSYDVEVMTAEEVGQYLLLLCKAWLLAKETCLPNDPTYLARIARTDLVSERVLAKFPIVETQWGSMRRNDTLYEEWMAAEARSDSGRVRVAARGGKWAETANQKQPEKYSGNTTVSPPVLRENIPIPTRTIPNQPEPNQEDFGDWELFRKRHSHLLGKKADSKLFQRKYEDSCRKFGPDVVWTCFEEWSEDVRDWVRREKVKHPLYAFFKNIESLADDEIANRESSAEEEKEKAIQISQLEKSIEAQKKADSEFMERAPQTNGASVFEYISDLS